MEQFNKAKVILIPTKMDSNLIHDGGNELMYLYDKSKDKNGWGINRQLLIISDDEIKDGDWYSSPNGIISQYNGKEVLPKGWWRIIASYPSLEDDMFLGCIQPQPSQQFIEQYIESYNKGEVITDVLVEYEEIKDTWTTLDTCTLTYKENLKINPENTITIKSVKNTWNREEHRINIMHCLSLFAAERGLTPTSKEMKEVNEWSDNWCKENL